LELRKNHIEPEAYYPNSHPKDSIYLHHTEGHFRPDWVISTWNRNRKNSTNKIRTAASLIIGGQDPLGLDNTYDGVAVEAFPPDAWAHNLAIKAKNNTFLNQKGISIEMCNYGPLTQSLDGKYYTRTHLMIPNDQIIELSEPFRGHKFFHSYSPKQLDTLRDLIKHLSERFEIDLKKGLKKEIQKSELILPENLNDHQLQKWLNQNGITDSSGKKLSENGILDGKTLEALENLKSDPFSIKIAALTGYPGLWSHSNVRIDVNDVYPHPELISMIKSL